VMMLLRMVTMHKVRRFNATNMAIDAACTL
jgi:hypothetical protein